jgi:hypothetical protein
LSRFASGDIFLIGIPVPIPLIASIVIYKFSPPPEPAGLWDDE